MHLDTVCTFGIDSWNNSHCYIATTLSQNCVCLTHPCMKLLVPSSVTRKYHPVPELFHLLQYNSIGAYLVRTLPWHSGETQYLGSSSAFFHSDLVARCSKPIKYMLNALFGEWKQDQILRKKQTVDPAASDCFTFIYSTVTVYPYHSDYEEVVAADTLVQWRN